ncbi:MAG: glycosyltransferase family 2 protein [Alphaproteobacteria bacterium]|nr:glycosyltransferase family 2 protein [Alphaproteobacteria bacterium]
MRKRIQGADSDHKIPVSVIVVTKNEAPIIKRCLTALADFDDVWVVDSQSADGTKVLAEAAGARVVDFLWNGRYPKKRQWCLETLDLKHDWVFFVDADEVMTAPLMAEIREIFSARRVSLEGIVGYFVKGRYMLDGKPLRYGLQNNKLCLFDRRSVAFPVVDDLDIPGMGEIEGHYQPVLTIRDGQVGQLQNVLIHKAFEDQEGWRARHERYAAWERAMIARNAYPRDPVPAREFLKRLFRRMPFRAVIAFLHCYVWKYGVLDGAAGWRFAKARWEYYRMLRKAQ